MPSLCFLLIWKQMRREIYFATVDLGNFLGHFLKVLLRGAISSVHRSSLPLDTSAPHMFDTFS